MQIGDPWVDPYKNVDESQFGTISGMVNTLVDGEAVALEEFDVWFFKVPQEGDFMYGGEPVFFLLDRMENGMFTAKLPQGEYHMEAFAYDFETDTPYKPKLAGGNESPTVFTIDGNTSVYRELISLWKRSIACPTKWPKRKVQLQSMVMKKSIISSSTFPCTPQRRGWQ